MLRIISSIRLSRIGLLFNPLLENMFFYAVAKGRNVGIYPSWAQCEAEIKGFPQAKFKKFSTQEEAENFIKSVDENHSRVTILSSNVSMQDRSISRPKSLQETYYAVAKGKKVGIYSTWMECKAQVDGEKYPKYKKFLNLKEAEQFIEENSQHKKQEKKRKSCQQSKTEKTVVPSNTVQCFAEMLEVSYGNHSFHVDDEGYVHVYTDGSCEGNGKSNARAGIGVWFGKNHQMNVGEAVEGPPTNNVGEIEAATKAIQIARTCGIPKLQINTDSQFLIRCVTEWAPKWRKNDWKLSSGGDVKNKVQLQNLHSVYDGIDIKWNYVQAHKGIEGNEEADTLARAGAAKFQRKVLNRYQPY